MTELVVMMMAAIMGGALARTPRPKRAHPIPLARGGGGVCHDSQKKFGAKMGQTGRGRGCPAGGVRRPRFLGSKTPQDAAGPFAIVRTTPTMVDNCKWFGVDYS